MRINNLNPNKITPYKQNNQRCNLAKFASFDNVSFKSKEKTSDKTIFNKIKNLFKIPKSYNINNISFTSKQKITSRQPNKNLQVLLQNEAIQNLINKRKIANATLEFLASLKEDDFKQLKALLRNKKIQESVSNEKINYSDLYNFATLEKERFKQLQIILRYKKIQELFNSEKIDCSDLYNFASLKKEKLEQLKTLLNNSKVLESINGKTIFGHHLYSFAKLEETSFKQLFALYDNEKIQKLINKEKMDGNDLCNLANLEEARFNQLQTLLNNEKIQKLIDENGINGSILCLLFELKEIQFSQLQTLLDDKIIQKLIDEDKINGYDLYCFASLQEDKSEQLQILLNNKRIHELLNKKRIRGYDISDFAEFRKDQFDILVMLMQRKGIKTQNGNSIINLIRMYSLINSNTNFSNIGFQEKIKLKEKLNEIKNLFTIKDLLNEDEIAKINSFIKKLSESINSIITPTQVNNENIHNMMSGFFANNNPQLEKLLATSDFSQFKKQGLPLKYPRQKFLEDLSAILENLSKDKQDEIINKLAISPIKNKYGKIIGYNGIINLNKLSNDKTEEKVLSIATKFIKENSIITGNKDLDNALNSLIEGMPEFINIIGKQQHLTQQFSVDIHILTVLQHAMSNKNYQNLSNLDKTCLKFATILHDIAKSEKTIDKSHPEFSAFYAKDILKKYNFPKEIKDRIFELVKNHHWLEKYNKNEVSADYTASLFRHKDDYAIAKIMADADLKGVSDEFYEYFSSALKEARQMPIQNSLNNINSLGQLIFTSKIIRKDLIPKIRYGDVDYKVRDFTKINQDTDLSKFGFAPEVTYDALRLLIHANNKAINLEAINALSDNSNGSFLCSSYISLDNIMTFSNKKFGASLEAENVNIANASSLNQTSGAKKDFKMFSAIITGNDNYLSQFRTKIPSIIKKELELTDEEYIELYELLASKKYLSQIKDDETYSIKGKNIKGEKIKKAIQKAQDELLNNETNNEINLYNPKINAFIARVNSIDKIPQEYLNFVQEYDLPIYLLGE